MLEVLFLLLGLGGLLVGTELVVRGALDISERFKISKIFIGLTVLAIGTDLPELTISISSAIDKLNGTDTSGLIVGDVIGSNFGQIILTLGFVGVFSYFTLTKKEVLREGGVLLGSILLLFILGLDGEINQAEGAAFIVIYIIYFLTIPREEPITDTTIKKAPPIHPFWASMSLLGGMGLVIFTSNIVVDNGIALTEIWGLKQTFIGIMIIGLGTSLPEVALSVRAAMKGAKGLSIGNLIGSNIFDTLFVLGSGAAISGINVSKEILYFDIPFLFIASTVVIIFFINKKGLQRKEALILLTIYIAYVALKFSGF